MPLGSTATTMVDRVRATVVYMMIADLPLAKVVFMMTGLVRGKAACMMTDRIRAMRVCIVMLGRGLVVGVCMRMVDLVLAMEAIEGSSGICEKPWLPSQRTPPHIHPSNLHAYFFFPLPGDLYSAHWPHNPPAYLPLNVAFYGILQLIALFFGFIPNFSSTCKYHTTRLFVSLARIILLCATIKYYHPLHLSFG
jgi:hypothetical protein